MISTTTRVATPIIAAASLLAVLAGPAIGVASATETAREIMDHVDQDHRSDDEQADADMIIKTKGQADRRRKIVALYQAPNEKNDNTVIRFVQPADIKGTALLTIEDGDTDETQYVFIPALRKTRRIASGSKTERFAGTDFTYEDLRTEQLDLYAYSIVKESEEVDGHDCWVIKAVPNTDKKREETGYKHRMIWVRKDHYLAVQIKYFDKAGKHSKTLRHLDWKETDGVWRFFKASMQDLQRGSITLMVYRTRKINPGLAERTFTKGELGKG